MTAPASLPGMHTKWLLAIFLVSAAFVGCVEDESTEEDDDANARQFTIDVPDGATQVHVDVTGDATAGEPDVTVLIEDERGNNLATDTFSVGDETQRRVSANVDGQDRLLITVRVVDGDASLDVRVVATVPDAPEVIVVQERIVIVQVVREPTPTPTPVTPTPSPAPSPTPTPTASPTPPTSNETNGTNTTG